MAKVWLQHGTSLGLFIKTLEPEAAWCRRADGPMEFHDELSAMAAFEARVAKAEANRSGSKKSLPKWALSSPKPFVELSAEDMSGSFDIWMMRDQGMWVCGSESLLFLDQRLAKAAYFRSKERARHAWKSPTACFIKLAAAICAVEAGSAGFDPISGQLGSIVEARDIEQSLRDAASDRLKASREEPSEPPLARESRRKSL